MLCAPELVQTAVVLPKVIVGNGLTVTVKLFVDDMHPFALLTVKVPVYVPAAVFAGIGILIGLAAKEALETGAKLFVGLAFHVML